MTVPDTDLARIRAYCEAKTPPDMRDELRLEADVRGNSVTIFDCRPPWQETDTTWSRLPVAQLRYQPAATAWTLYWADQKSRWHVYDEVEPNQPVRMLIDEIEADSTCIFWG